MIPDLYLIPWMYECTYHLGDATIIHYWTQAAEIGKSKLQNAVVPRNIYVSSRLISIYTHAFWIENTSKTIRQVSWRFTLVYLDDIIIFLRTPEEHIYHVWQFQTILHDMAETLKLKSC